MAKVGTLKKNPENPRIIKDEKFRKLVESIKTFPKMLEIRPIVVNADMVVLGGNMRLKACIDAGMKEVPVIIADDLTYDQQREFIIKDNVGFGEWDWEILAKDWETVEIGEWGLESPELSEGGNKAVVPDLDSAWFLSIEFDNEQAAEELYNRLESEGYTCKIVT